MNSKTLWFESSRFTIIDGEDLETNPGVYGLTLSEWVKQKLESAGYNCNRIHAEDWGRSFNLEGANIMIGVSNRRGEQAEWGVFVEGDVSQSWQRNPNEKGVREVEALIREEVVKFGGSNIHYESNG